MREKKAKKILSKVKTTYNNIAEEFSNTRHKPGKEFNFFTKYLFEGSTIVDLGCGNGRLVPYLQSISNKWSKKFNYTGIDNNEDFIKISKGRYPNHKFILGDQLNIPLKDNSVDTIMNIRAFHHIPSKKLRKKGMEEMNRILKKNGVIIISVWNLWQKKYIKHLIIGLLRCIITLGRYDYNDFFIPWGKSEKRYYHAFTKRELTKLISKSGFEQLEFHNKYHDLIIIAQKHA